jgi:hypothetical protein
MSGKGHSTQDHGAGNIVRGSGLGHNSMLAWDHNAAVNCLYVCFTAALQPDSTYISRTDAMPLLEEYLTYANHMGLVFFDYNKHGQILGMEVHQSTRWFRPKDMEVASEGSVIIWFNHYCRCDVHAKNENVTPAGQRVTFAANPSKPTQLCFIRIWPHNLY